MSHNPVKVIDLQKDLFFSFFFFFFLFLPVMFGTTLGLSIIYILDLTIQAV